jgi:mono/diheme cytochrome c family protein
LFYKGNAIPSLRGKLLLACLRGESIISFSVDHSKLTAEETFFKKQYGRIRALATDDKGFIYFSTSQNDPPEGTGAEGYDMILRLRPAVSNNPTPRMTTSTVTSRKTRTVAPSGTRKLYAELCASCHGNNLEGTARAESMLDDNWNYGSAKMDIIKVIRNGAIEKGMPAWEGAISEKDMQNLADFIISKTIKTKPAAGK